MLYLDESHGALQDGVLVRGLHGSDLLGSAQFKNNYFAEMWTVKGGGTGRTCFTLSGLGEKRIPGRECGPLLMCNGYKAGNVGRGSVGGSDLLGTVLNLRTTTSQKCGRSRRGAVEGQGRGGGSDQRAELAVERRHSISTTSLDFLVVLPSRVLLWVSGFRVYVSGLTGLGVLV